MKRLRPEELKASRVYFTEFDRTTYSQVALTEDDVAQLKRNLERKLKLLALVKGHVVIAASHLLESELAREVILPYPELFSKRVVVPALRSEFATCLAFLDTKRNDSAPGEARLYEGEEQAEMARLIDGMALVVEWDVNATSGWFRDTLVTSLRSEKSLVNLALRKRNHVVPESLCAELDQAPTLSRNFVHNLTEDIADLDSRAIINGYADFLYYLSGARAVNSEGVLPQENIVDFGLADLTGQKTALSEREVFFKIFIDIVKTATSMHFPADLLDALSIRDAVSLHGVALEDRFIEKYNAIQEKTQQGLAIQDPERLVLNLQELEAFERDLHHEFTTEIRHELPARLREMRLGHGAELLHAVASLLLVPYGLVFSTKDVIVSGLRLAGKESIAASVEKRIRERLDAWRELIDRRDSADKAILLGYVGKLKTRYTDKLFGRE